jgi:hypothetical protein
MEVMLEIYKSLDQLGMEWKKKKDIVWPDIGTRPENSAYTPEVEQILDAYTEQTGQEYIMGRARPDKTAKSNQEKMAQNLFLVETRHRYGNVMVGVSFLRVVIILLMVGSNGFATLPRRSREFPGRFQKHWILPRKREGDANSRSWIRSWIIVKSESEKGRKYWWCLRSIPFLGDGLSIDS